MPAFLVRFAIWIARVLFPSFINPFLRFLLKFINMSWKQFWYVFSQSVKISLKVIVKFLDKITKGLFSKYWKTVRNFVSVIFTWIIAKVTGFWKWLTRSGAGVGGVGGVGAFVLSKPILILLVFIAVWFADFFANFFGYSFMGIVIYILVSILATVMAWWLDFIWTLIDFSSLIDFMGYWSGLPSCFVDVALAAGLSNALSALFVTATACVTIVFIQSLIRR